MSQPQRCVSALSGHELFCLHHMGLRPGPLLLGNSVYALGARAGLTASLSNLGGGEISEVTSLMHEGRQRAIARLVDEAKKAGGSGVTGVSFNTMTHGLNLEFVAQGAAVYGTMQGASEGSGAAAGGHPFHMAGTAQDLYSYNDSGFVPHEFVFGNVAYSIGVGGSIRGRITSLARGEVSAFTEIFDRTRHLALERIVQEAKACRANAVLGITTAIRPLWGTQEMTMVGTAASHPLLSAHTDQPITSDLTAEETWNICNMGMMPLQLVMGVTVYSLGLAGGIWSRLRSLVRGEVGPLTHLLYEARDRSLARLHTQATALGADQVIGVKLRINVLRQGLVEVIALGTAIKKFQGAQTRTPQLLPQALAVDRETFVESADGAVDRLTANKFGTRPTSVGTVFLRCVYITLIAAAAALKMYMRGHTPRP